MTVAQAYAEWALALSASGVPSEAKRFATRHLLDGLGCAIAASRLDEGKPAFAAARSLGTGIESSIIGCADRLAAPAAALVNGTLVHALDFDDTHAGALVHATAAVLPAAFAVGEAVSATGEEVLAAAIAGYEVVARLGAAVPHGFHARGFHATSVCGVFASALIAAKLMALDVPTTVNALGIAGSLAGGSLEFLATGSTTKQLHPGLSSMAGILAARLASAGAEGPSSIFEGEHGLFAAYLGERVDPARLTDGLGERWEVTRITIKPYPACQLSHASLDALRTLLPKIDDLDAIRNVTFVVPVESVPIVCEPAGVKAQPRTSYEGKFSLPYSAAALIADGTLDVSSFQPAKLLRNEVVELASRVRYTTRELSPPAEAPGEVRITLSDGEQLHASVPASRGGPDVPLADDDVAAKFLANGGTSELARLVLTLEEQGSVRPVLEATR